MRDLEGGPATWTAVESILRARGIGKIEFYRDSPCVQVTHESGLYTAGGGLLDAIANFDELLLRQLEMKAFKERLQNWCEQHDAEPIECSRRYQAACDGRAFAGGVRFKNGRTYTAHALTMDLVFDDLTRLGLFFRDA